MGQACLGGLGAWGRSQNPAPPTTPLTASKLNGDGFIFSSVPFWPFSAGRLFGVYWVKSDANGGQHECN